MVSCPYFASCMVQHFPTYFIFYPLFSAIVLIFRPPNCYLFHRVPFSTVPFYFIALRTTIKQDGKWETMPSLYYTRRAKRKVRKATNKFWVQAYWAPVKFMFMAKGLSSQSPGRVKKNANETWELRKTEVSRCIFRVLYHANRKC